MSKTRIHETPVHNKEGELTYNMAVFNSYEIKDQLKCLGFTFGTCFGQKCWRKDYTTQLIRNKVHAIVEEANIPMEKTRTFPTLQEA